MTYPPDCHPTKHLVMAVEDDSVSRAIIDGMLRESNYQVCFASTTSEFLAKLSTIPNKPDLLIIDSWVDDMFCSEVINLIPAELSVPIVIASGDDDILDKIRSTGLAISPQLVLQKPFSRTQLLNTLDRAVYQA